MNILDFDVLEEGSQLRVFAQREHDAVAVEGFEQFGTRLLFDLSESGAHHKLDTGSSAVGEVYVAAIDAVYVDIKPHGTHQGYAVGDAECMRATKSDGNVFAGFVVNEFPHFGIREIELHKASELNVFFLQNNV